MMDMMRKMLTAGADLGVGLQYNDLNLKKWDTIHAAIAIDCWR